MSVKIIAVFLSYLFASGAFHNSSCAAPTHHKILLGSNVHTQATKIVCDDHIEISISKIDVTPSGKKLRSLSTGKFYDQNFFQK